MNNKRKSFFNKKIKLVKGTRFVSFIFIGISILIAAGVLLAANMYYDIDAGKIVVNEVQDIISTAAYQFKVAYDATKYFTASIASSGTTTLASTYGLDITASATSTWKTTDGRLTLQTEGTGDDIFIIANDVFDLDATTLNLDASSGINIGTAADVPFDIDTAALTIDASGAITVTSTGAGITLYGTTTVGVDGAGYLVTIYGDTAGNRLSWDDVNNKFVLTGTAGSNVLEIISGNMVATGSVEIYNPISLAQVALTVTQATTSNNIVEFIGAASQQLSVGLDVNGNLVLTSNKKFTITAGNNDIVIDTGSGTLRVPSGRITVAGDAVLTEPGQQILRGVVPVFGFDLPAQTASTSYVTVSRIIENYPFPANASGTTRVHKFVIRYADDIPTASTSDWQVYTNSEYSTFTIPGCNSTTSQGQVYIATTTIPTDGTDWYLKVKTPNVATIIRIYQIFLAAYDQLP